MISIDFTELNESSKNFILSVAVGSEVVIKSLLDTAYRHLDALESISAETLNAQLHFDCSVSIISQVYKALVYINFHSMDVFTDEFKSPLDSDLETISYRFVAAMLRIKKEVPNVR